MSKSQQATGVSTGTLRRKNTFLLIFAMKYAQIQMSSSSNDSINYISVASVTSAISRFISIPEFRWLKNHCSKDK